MASPRKALGCQSIATASPIAADRPARTSAIGRPSPATAGAGGTVCWRLASHAAPAGAAAIALEVALAVTLGARSHSHAMTSHKAAQAVLAPRGPSSPPGRFVGHTSRPIIAYSTTAPGAPVSGLAVLLNRSPNASANHHTMNDQAKDTASAPFTVGRQSSPSPMMTCVNEDSVFKGVRLDPRRWADHRILLASQYGSPAAPSAIVWTKPRVYMNDW